MTAYTLTRDAGPYHTGYTEARLRTGFQEARYAHDFTVRVPKVDKTLVVAWTHWKWYVSHKGYDDPVLLDAWKRWRYMITYRRHEDMFLRDVWNHWKYHHACMRTTKVPAELINCWKHWKHYCDVLRPMRRAGLKADPILLDAWKKWKHLIEMKIEALTVYPLATSELNKRVVHVCWMHWKHFHRCNKEHELRRRGRGIVWEVVVCYKHWKHCWEQSRRGLNPEDEGPYKLPVAVSNLGPLATVTCAVAAWRIWRDQMREAKAERGRQLKVKQNEVQQQKLEKQRRNRASSTIGMKAKEFLQNRKSSTRYTPAQTKNREGQFETWQQGRRRKAAVKLQKYVRGWLARLKYGEFVRNPLKRVRKLVNLIENSNALFAQFKEANERALAETDAAAERLARLQRSNQTASSALHGGMTRIKRVEKSRSDVVHRFVKLHERVDFVNTLFREAGEVELEERSAIYRTPHTYKYIAHAASHRSPREPDGVRQGVVTFPDRGDTGRSHSSAAAGPSARRPPSAKSKGKAKLDLSRSMDASFNSSVNYSADESGASASLDQSSVLGGAGPKVSTRAMLISKRIAQAEGFDLKKLMDKGDDPDASRSSGYRSSTSGSALPSLNSTTVSSSSPVVNKLLRKGKPDKPGGKISKWKDVNPLLHTKKLLGEVELTMKKETDKRYLDTRRAAIVPGLARQAWTTGVEDDSGESSKAPGAHYRDAADGWKGLRKSDPAGTMKHEKIWQKGAQEVLSKLQVSKKVNKSLMLHGDMFDDGEVKNRSAFTAEQQPGQAVGKGRTNAPAPKPGAVGLRAVQAAAKIKATAKTKDSVLDEMRMLAEKRLWKAHSSAKHWEGGVNIGPVKGPNVARGTKL